MADVGKFEFFDELGMFLNDFRRKEICTFGDMYRGTPLSSLAPKVWPGTGGVGTPSFCIKYGSISFGQLSDYIVFCILLIGGGFAPSVGMVPKTM